MLDVQNRTPFVAALLSSLNKEGLEQAVVLVKGTFVLRGSGAPAVADEQAPLVYSDQHRGEPGTSSVRYESDVGPSKPGTDVLLIGHARAPGRPVEALDVEVRVGPVRKVVRVFGDRVYFRGSAGWAISPPQRFTEMPLIYERAFGGADRSEANPGRRRVEERNHVGVGYWSDGARASASLEGQPLPNIEDPASLIRDPGDHPCPAGFGFLGRSWRPRAAYAGTYDQRWAEERCPLLPLDFDERYYNAAHPDLVSAAPLQGGEPALITNVMAGGASQAPLGGLSFQVPARALEVLVRCKGRTTAHAARLDTLVIEPDEGRLLLIWRAVVACPRSFLLIDRVTVREAGRA